MYKGKTRGKGKQEPSKRKFSNFKSRWMIPCACKYRTAENISISRMKREDLGMDKVGGFRYGLAMMMMMMMMIRYHTVDSIATKCKE